jgi:retrograde regulation protein 2
VEELQSEVRETVKAAYESLRVPDEMLKRADDEGGFTLYLSGGGYVASYSLLNWNVIILPVLTILADSEVGDTSS